MTKVLRDEALNILGGVLKKMKRTLDGVERWSVRYDSEVGALLKHLGGGKRELVVARWYLLDGGTVEDFRLEEELRDGRCE